MKARTAVANEIRGLLAEFGIVIPQGIHHIALRIPEILEDGDNGLPGTFKQLLHRLGEHLAELELQVGESWSKKSNGGIVRMLPAVA